VHGRIKRSVHCRLIVSDVATRGDEMTDLEAALDADKALNNNFFVKNCRDQFLEAGFLTTTQIAQLYKIDKPIGDIEETHSFRVAGSSLPRLFSR